MTEATGRIDKTKSIDKCALLTSLATPLRLARHQATLHPNSLNGCSFRFFPEQGRPELLVLFSKWFVGRAIRLEVPRACPRFDLRFRSDLWP